MSFKLNITKTARSEGRQSEVDWDALNAHVISVAGTAQRSRSIPGVISGIYDLGVQERPDYEEVWNGNADAEAAAIAENESIYFKDEGGKRWKCRPQQPCQQIAIAVDFPQVMVDKGQFFGSSNPAPLRMLLNGEYTLNRERVVGRGFSLSEMKHPDGTWAFPKQTVIHKLADAAGLTDEKGLFYKENIGDLIGGICQFEFRVYMKPSKDGRLFFTEDIKLVGMVPEGISVPTLDEKYFHLVNMSGENNEEYVKQMRVSIKNTIKKAKDYEGSDIQKLLEGSAGARPSPTPKAEKPVESKPRGRPKKAAAVDVDAPLSDDPFDDDVPF
jgi:hypothetical protein